MPDAPPQDVELKALTFRRIADALSGKAPFDQQTADGIARVFHETMLANQQLQAEIERFQAAHVIGHNED